MGVVIRNGRTYRVRTPEERRALAADRGPVPQVVTKLQLVRHLHETGDLATLTATLATMPDADREWEAAQEIHRGHEMTALVGAALSKTEAELDTIFREAMKK